MVSWACEVCRLVLSLLGGSNIGFDKWFQMQHVHRCQAAYLVDYFT
jgi:hypothetical protein